MYISLFRKAKTQEWMIPITACFEECEAIEADEAERSAGHDSDDDATMLPPQRRRKLLEGRRHLFAKGFKGEFTWTVPDWVTTSLFIIFEPC